MTVREKLELDLKGAQKKGEQARVDTLRLLLSELHNREIEKHGKGGGDELTDEEALAVLKREAKKRKEAIELFRRGNRNDLAEKEEGELSILAAYLPAEMSRGEIEAVVNALIAEGHKDFNGLMKEAMARLRGRADGRAVSEVIKGKLG